MKTLRSISLLVVTLAIPNAVAGAQEKQPPSEAGFFALEITYLKGAPPTFGAVPPAGAKRGGGWFGRFGRIEGFQPEPGSLPVRAVNILSQTEGEAVRIDVSVFVGVQYHDKELAVASYLLRESERVTA